MRLCKCESLELLESGLNVPELLLYHKQVVWDLLLVHVCEAIGGASKI